MSGIVIGFDEQGSMRAIDGDPIPLVRVFPQAEVFRASHLFPINNLGGARHGWYYADMSPLAEYTGQPEHSICLFPPQPTYDLAKQQEDLWLKKNYLTT